MSTFRWSLSSPRLSLRKLLHNYNPPSLPHHLCLQGGGVASSPKMSTSTNSDQNTNTHFIPASASTSMAESYQVVPGGGLCSSSTTSPDEMDRVAEQTFQRYTISQSSSDINARKSGKGVAIVWFRNDLRVLDNEALYRAWVSSEAVLPLYCVDPRLVNATTHYFGFPKTGAFRARFLIECLADLKKKLMKMGLNLLIQHGKPEEIIPTLVKAYGAHTVYAHKETCSEEVNVERLVSSCLRKMETSTNSTKLQLVWGSTMYHIDDLPFNTSCLPDVYTQFRKSVESKSKVRGCIKIPSSLGPPPSIGDWGHVPSLDQLGHLGEKASSYVNKGMRFVGGESAALSRVNEYFWKKASQLFF
ncbi:hypothetical protein RHMOL_Rhmol07G0217200 [Rhododendron molle]|uniref:Uncharacterized protein n=1 Tax=Rhododendron molle TaxID=49168 RepID=A0ACC0N317_RHOML|nr:hypothetical protein RHMOL_Rhmol07G0217200 [Rhododendron molle]